MTKDFAYSIRVKTGDIVTGLITHGITFYYNSKTHRYHIVDDTQADELIMSKAKAEAVIKFLQFIKT